MSGENGVSPAGVDSPVVYPSLEVPGRGTFVVKFGTRASFILEQQFQMTPADFAKRLSEWLPRADPDDANRILPGKASNVFVFTVLSACLWKQTHMLPEDLADAFEISDRDKIAAVLMEAFSKTQWSAKAPLREPATVTEPTPILQ